VTSLSNLIYFTKIPWNFFNERFNEDFHAIFIRAKSHIFYIITRPPNSSACFLLVLYRNQSSKTQPLLSPGQTEGQTNRQRLRLVAPVWCQGIIKFETIYDSGSRWRRLRKEITLKLHRGDAAVSHCRVYGIVSDFIHYRQHPQPPSSSSSSGGGGKICGSILR